GYSWGKNQFLYSFLGMAPAKDPKLVMYVAVKKPKLKVTEVGSEPISKIFNAVMESSLKYLNVGTTKQKKIDSVKIADY
ncbi:penicillin-binding transpeptidase domain-containing protein, partial [Bacteroides uniformis]|uniref:penicillin-binding transpeptidase domain-containing protein n=1 Tax=Bacteroides uniformis TaxID=820 RepID=UPI001EDE4956